MNGGALELYSSNIQIISSVFIDNIGRLGGSIYLGKCRKGCIYLISKTEFKRNTAEKIGGGIYYTQQRPTMENNTFSNNEAAYGQNIGSIGIKYLFNGEKELKIENAVSSQKYGKTFTISIVDYDNQVMILD